MVEELPMNLTFSQKWLRKWVDLAPLDCSNLKAKI